MGGHIAHNRPQDKANAKVKAQVKNTKRKASGTGSPDLRGGGREAFGKGGIDARRQARASVWACERVGLTLTFSPFFRGAR